VDTLGLRGLCRDGGAVKVIDPDDETIVIPINRRTHKVSTRDETDLHQTVYIEPLDTEPKKQEEEK